MARLLALSLAALLAWTSGAGAGDAPSCDVLKPREVKKATGHAVRSTGPALGVGGECTFTVKGSPLDVVSVWVIEGDDAEPGYELGTQFDGKKVDDIGDEAFYVEDPFNTLYVLDDDVLVYLQWYQPSGDDTAEKIERAVIRMTKKVLSRT
jgi:hypothetical protein